MKSNEILVVVPTYNNDKTIQAVVNDILKHKYKVLVVDDAYTNPVQNILKKDKNLSIIRHKINLGKGQAITSGALRAKKLGYKYFISLDGDGQHLANEIIKLLNICTNDNEIIIGARDFNIKNVPNASKFGRWFSNFWARWNTQQEINDSLSGFRLYPICILDLDIKTKRFDWEMEVLVKHSWSNKAIKEVTINCYYPSLQERVSHFKKFWDTLSIVMVHIRLLPLKFILKKKYNK